VTVKAKPPAVAELGDKVGKPGAGLLMLKVFAAVVPPPGAAFTAVTKAVPSVARSEAGTWAVTPSAPTNVVTSGTPFQSTTVPLTKFVPASVIVKAEPPTIPVVGLMEVSVGAGLLMVKVCPADVPPPGVGFVTVTVAVPAVEISAKGTETVTEVALTRVASSSAPFQFTKVLSLKLVPVSVSVKPEPPAIAEVGDKEVRVGAGLLMLKVCAAEVPPTGVGLNTVTEAVPESIRSVDGTAAVSDVALTKVVVSAEPFQSTTEPVTKFVPVSVRVNADPPTPAEVGEIEVSVGAGLLMVKVCPELVPPPGATFTTVTLGVPPVAISEAGTDAVSDVALPNVVVSGEPFQFATEPATKFVPVSVSVKAEPPAAADVGAIEVSVGVGLLMVNVCAVDVPPPGVGVNTVTEDVPTRATSDAGTVAVSEVALPNTVTSAVPFQFTTEPLTKLVPVTVSVNVESPAVAEVGRMDVRTGAGLLTVNVCADEVPPAGRGLKTVTEKVPPTEKSDAGTVAVNDVALTNVVVKAEPFQFTTELFTKFVPVTVSVSCGSPAFPEVGEIEASVGAGFGASTTSETVEDVLEINAVIPP
jgi:hypothetical protein